MVLREIPSLRVLCLRAVGSHDCNAEVTFSPTKSGDPSTASRLLQSFHRRPVADEVALVRDNGVDGVSLTRLPCVGPSTSRRAHANDVDMNHPFIASGSDFVIQRGNPAVDCLQSYIDSLVELGRMDDTRLGKRFFQEWVRCCSAGVTKKRKRGSPTTPPPLGSLSLHNCSIAERTLKAMVSSKATSHFLVLDLTGMQQLTDTMVKTIVEGSRHLERLSLKNCRRVTSKSLGHVAKSCKGLVSLDVGGSVNLSTQDVLDIVPSMESLVDLNVSGLGWNDMTLMQLMECQNEWEGLSIGFSAVTTAGLRDSLQTRRDSLQRLAIPFCEVAVDNAFLGYLGKIMTHLTVLDIRGNGSVNTLTGWYDGRASNMEQNYDEELFVLARYTSISKSSLEETKRIHPLHSSRLTCILDGGGSGAGIRRLNN